MTMRTSTWVGFAGLALILAIVPARAQEYPAQDIHFICSFPPGSGADVLVRYFAEKIRPLAGRNIIVENKPGAGGRIATESVIRAKPDGYTIYVSAGHGVASTQYFFKQPIDTVNTIRMAATINRQPFMMLVDAKKPYKTVAEVTAALMPKGDKATYGTSAPPSQVMGAMFREAFGLQAIDVNYKTGADGLNDLFSGALDYALFDPVLVVAQQKQGKLRVLGISSGQRMAAAPDFPTMAESGVPLMNLNLWWSAMVPQGTPRPVIEQLNTWFNQVTSSDEAKTFLNNFASDPYLMTADQTQKELQREMRDWADYVRIAKIEPQG